MYRFIGESELQALKENQMIIGRTQVGSSSCHGHEVICFMPDETDTDYSVLFLAGIVGEVELKKGQPSCFEGINVDCPEDYSDYYIIVRLEDESHDIKEGYGIYTDPFGGFFDRMNERELYIKNYDLNDVIEFQIIRKSGYDINVEVTSNNIDDILNRISEIKKERASLRSSIAKEMWFAKRNNEERRKWINERWSERWDTEWL